MITSFKVLNERLCLEKWEKFCADFIVDPSSFSLEELRTSYISGWADCLASIGLLVDMVEGDWIQTKCEKEND